jgi:hypothetical protein
MLVLVPQALVDSPHRGSKHALKIVSQIVCGHLKECHDFRSKFHLKGKPSDPRAVFGSWINIEGKSLKNICGEYNQVCRNLEHDGFIERNHHYSNFEDKFPKSFRLHSNCWPSPLVLHAVNQRLSKKKFHCVVGDGGGDLNGEYRAAESQLGLFELPEDQAGRLNAICDHTDWPDDAKRRVAELYAGTWWSKVDEFGRYHTPFTNLPKGIRRELRCEGVRVAGFDFRNFQPSLLTLHAAEGFSVNIPDEERSRYSELCRAGQIYEFIAVRCPSPTTRMEAKKAFLAMLNKTNQSMKKMEVYSAFAEFFPAFANLVQQIKKDDHVDMARFLQGAEARIMFGGVVRSYRAKTAAPFFTVHDAIYTTHDKKHILRDALDQQIKIWNIPTTIEEERELSTYTEPPPTNVGMNSASCVGLQSALI